MYLDLIEAIRDNKQSEYTKYLTKYRIKNLKDVKGVDDEITVGTHQVPAGSFNLLHWIVYTNRLDALKLLCENQRFNIL